MLIKKQAMQYAGFDGDKAAALEWRSQNGGWIFETECGNYIWFNICYTPTPIYAHHATAGFSGRLI